MLIPEKYDVFPSRAVQSHFGVTRLARITGLDRTGIEVCSAIRPGGHVLQVSNGKGLSFASAAVAALSEAAELAAAERVNTLELTYGSRRQLEVAGVVCVWPEEEVTGEAEHLFMGWVRGSSLASGELVLVPAHFVYCPPPGVFLGPRVFRWNTNGLAAHHRRADAIRHAMRELIERDQLAFCFPQGWTPEAESRRVIAPDELRPLVEELCARGFELELFDARPGAKDGLGVPVAAALLFDKEGGPVPLTAGYGCAPDYVDALKAALLEAAQSRLTDIHGAREDIVKDDGRGARTMRGWFKGPARKSWRGKRAGVLSAAEEISLLHRALSKVGEVVVVDLEHSPLSVVRVVVPGVAVSELL